MLSLSLKGRKFFFIFVNDGSTDNSYELLTHYAKEYDRVFLIDLPSNSGQSYARNVGIKKALEIGGLGIGFLDIDDCVSSDFFKILHNWSGLSVLVTGFQSMKHGAMIESGFEKLDDFSRLPNGRDYTKLLATMKATFSSCNKIFPLKNINFFPVGVKEEDTIHSFEFFSKFDGEVVKVDNATYFYCHDGISSTKTLDFRIFDSIYVANNLKKLLLSIDMKEDADKVFDFFSSFVFRHRLKKSNFISFLFFLFLYCKVAYKWSIPKASILKVVAVYVKNKINTF